MLTSKQKEVNTVRMGRRHRAIRIDDDVWEKAGPILKEVGLNRSRFIELTLKSLVDGREKTMEETMGALFEDMVNDALKVVKVKKTK